MTKKLKLLGNKITGFASPRSRHQVVKNPASGCGLRGALHLPGIHLASAITGSRILRIW